MSKYITFCWLCGKPMEYDSDSLDCGAMPVCDDCSMDKTEKEGLADRQTTAEENRQSET